MDVRKFFRITIFAAAAALFSVSQAVSQDTLVTKGAVWKYLDDGSDQGTAWRMPDFDDSQWKEGPAELGYGDGDEATVLSYGSDPNNKPITYYFRHRFTVDDSSRRPWLALHLLRDDGAVVYLNGKEVVRSNMPSGEITFKTLASRSVYSTAEKTFYRYFVLSHYLRTGENVLAVEVHQNSRSSSDLSFDLHLEFTSEVPQVMRKGPYLIFPEKNTEMTVLWQLTLQLPGCRLEWGRDTGYSLGTVNVVEQNADHQYRYTISGLQPDTFYRYRLIAGADTLTGSFRTAADSSATEAKFIVYGDTRSQPVWHDRVAERILQTIRSDSSWQTFLLSTGDLVANGNQESDWDQQFFNRNYPNIQTMLANLPYLAAIGNHEGQGRLFAKYFPYHFIQSGRYYWSFDYGPAHFTVIDEQNSYSPGTAQYAWIESDLASSSKRWKFVVLHKPGWSAGGHSNKTEVQQYIQPLCQKYGVQIVFAGHNHYYARAVVQNVVHITTGGGGAPLYSPNPNMPYVVKTAKTYHFCLVEIHGDSLKLTAVNTNGQTIDQFSLSAAVTGVAESGSALPETFQLLPAYPNPFNPGTVVEFVLPSPAKVMISVYNLKGERLWTEVHNDLPAGKHRFFWNGRNKQGLPLPSGVYLIQVQTAKAAASEKVLLLR